MRVFLYEYLCARATGAGDPTEESLTAEGRAMRDSVAADLTAAGAEVILFGPADYSQDEAIPFRRRAATANLTLVIAPEFGGILEQRCRWVLEAGGRLLGPSPEAVRSTADKARFCDYLRSAGVPTPRTWPDPIADVRGSFPQVWKPRDGAGSIATVRVDTPGDMARARRIVAESGWTGEMIGQEWVPGRPASVSFLAGKTGAVPLLPAWQHVLFEGGRLEYVGGSLPIPEPFARRAVGLASRAVRCLPNLIGYLGVDLVLGETAGDDRVIELNPRLTTSYVGLRHLSEVNLAAAILALAQNGPLPDLSWKPGRVAFGTDGTLTDMPAR